MNVGLIANRDMPVKEYIYPEDVDAMDMDEIDAIAETWCRCNKRGTVSLYVKGCVIEMAAVITWAVFYRIDLDLMHYDPGTGEYFRQKLLAWKRCSLCGNPMLPDDTYCGKCGAS